MHFLSFSIKQNRNEEALVPTIYLQEEECSCNTLYCLLAVCSMYVYVCAYVCVLLIACACYLLIINHCLFFLRRPPCGTPGLSHPCRTAQTSLLPANYYFHFLRTTDENRMDLSGSFSSLVHANDEFSIVRKQAQRLLASLLFHVVGATYSK